VGGGLVACGIKIPFLEFHLLLNWAAPYLQFATTNTWDKGGRAFLRVVWVANQTIVAQDTTILYLYSSIFFLALTYIINPFSATTYHILALGIDDNYRIP